MKSIFTAFGLAACFALASTETPRAQTHVAAQTRAKCLQKCFDDYLDDLDDCQDMCFVCDLWILVCVAGHTNLECVEQCTEHAEDDYEECKSHCPPPLGG